VIRSIDAVDCARIMRGLVFLVLACGCSDRVPPSSFGDSGASDSGVSDSGSGPDARADAGMLPARDAALDSNAACALATESAIVERAPVDIIWVIDNSVSMEPAIGEVQRGLNEFAMLVGSRELDYRVIMLSLRGRGMTTVGGSSRFAVCIPPPLSGDASCGDGERFFQVPVDIRSTQPIEQFLGTLAQTAGFTEEEERGGPPWRMHLRDEATKTIVVVTDDNARTCGASGSSCAGDDPPLTPTSLEDFPGGGNPFNSTVLGPGIRTATYGTLFEGYTFNALYGWGSETDPALACTYGDGTMPPSSGPTYTALVTRTGGVRAQICDGAAAWGPFFSQLATAVDRTSRLDCTVSIPPPPDGLSLDPGLVNVYLREDDASSRIGKVSGAAACDERGGWYYDDDEMPSSVILCPTSCEAVQPTGGSETGIDVEFGCATVLI
jgi:hypothetical protein